MFHFLIVLFSNSKSRCLVIPNLNSYMYKSTNCLIYKLHSIPHDCQLKNNVRISDFPIQSLDEIRRGYYIWSNTLIDYDRRPNLAGVFVELGSHVYSF